MIKTKQKPKGKLLLSWILIFTFLLTSLPMDSYAAPPTQKPLVKSLSVQSVQGKYTRIYISGEFLQGAEFIMNTKNLRTLPEAKIDAGDSYFSVEFSTVSGDNTASANLPILANNILNTSNVIGSQEYEIKFGTDYPTLSVSDRKGYLGKPYKLSGQNLKDKGDYINEKDSFFIVGNRQNDDYSVDGNQVTINNLKGDPGLGRDITIRIDFQDSGNLYRPTNTSPEQTVQVKSYYEFTLEKVIDIKKPFDGLDYMSVVPKKGTYKGGTTLNITAMANADPDDPDPAIAATSVPILDKDIFKDTMRVRLVKKDDPTKIVQTINPLVVKNPAGQGIGLTVDTLPVSINDVNEDFHMEIYNVFDNNEESIKQNAFRYMEGGSSLDLASILPPKGPDGGNTLVQIKGINLLNIDEVEDIVVPDGTVPNGEILFKPSSTTIGPDPNDKEWLLISYIVPSGTTYGGKPVDTIYRKVRVYIGRNALPQQLNILDTEPTPIDSAHFMSKNPKLDGVVFKTQGLDASVQQTYDVNVETKTYIKLVGMQEYPPIVERDILEGKYTFDRTTVNPTVESVEPLYGYYNNLGALGLDQSASADKDNVKPLMLRLKGKNFEVRRELNPVTNQYEPIYPKIEIRNNEALAEEFKTPLGEPVFRDAADIENKTKVIKVLKADGTVVDGQGQNRFGEIMVIEVAPQIDVTQFSSFILQQGTEGNGFKDLKARFAIIQKSGNNNGSIASEPTFDFRYPTNSDKQKQPHIENVYYAGSPTRVINSDLENEITVRFISYPVTNLDKVVVTIDGMDMKDRIIKRDYDEDGSGYAYIILKTPKGISGKTRLEVISLEGLMDSYNLDFQPVNGPFLKELIPNNGQAGTWVVVKRNDDINNIGFIMPQNNDPNTASKILIDGQPISGAIVKDSNTMVFQIPENTTLGNHNIQVENPDKSRSQGLPFLVRDVHGDVVEIQSIDPDHGDLKGGIPSTITAKPGTNFSGGVDVYFGSQKAKIIGTNLDFTEVYVDVPPLVDIKLKAGEQYTVPVTLQKKESGATATVKEGFTYFNPTYSDLMKITSVYKKDVQPKTNKGNAGDLFWVEGDNLLGVTTGSALSLELQYPDIYFGYSKVEIVDKEEPGTLGQIHRFPRILVKIPPKPLNIAQDGSLNVMVINPDGGTAILEKGFIYNQGKPEIIENDSMLKASKFFDEVKISAKGVYKNDLIVAFGDKSNFMDLTSTEDYFSLFKPKGDDSDVVNNDVEKIVIKYLPKATDGKNFEIYYDDQNGNLVLMNDAINTDNGKIALNKVGEKVIVGVNWKNPAYHKNSTLNSNPDLISKLNTEYISLEIVQDGRVNKVVGRRGLGKILNYSVNNSTNVASLVVATPYHSISGKTTITVINQDGTFDTAPFEFHGGTDAPVITDLEGSKERTVEIDGVQKKVQVKTQDYTVDGTVKIIGKNFKDVQSVKFGTKDVKIESVSPDYTYMIVSVPKATQGEVGKPLEVIVVTKEGNGFSSKTVPPVYFMYIAADSKPVIETVSPVVGPRTGGTLVTIKGKGFREKDEFGVISDKVEERITITVNGSMPAGLKSTVKNEQGEIVELKVIMPPSVTGKAKLQVVNADGGTSEPKDFTYVSQPKISKTEGSIFFNDTTTEVRLFGEDFLSGAKVVIGAEQTKGKKPADASVTGMLGVTTDGINQEAHLVGGVEAANVTVTGTNQITFKMPDGIESLENTSIIIVNPDTGMSEPGQGNIKPPVPDVPDIEAIPGFERTMLLRWKVDKDVLNAAEKFEIYVRERRSGDYTFVGDTKQDTTEQSYVIKGLKYDTTYDILVRVLNKYGEAEDFASVRETTLRQSQDYKEKEKVDAVDDAVYEIETQGKQEVIGDTLYYTVGTRESTINLSNTTAKNKTKYVQIPVKDIKSGNKTITITDKDLSLTVSYSSLNTPELRNAPDDAVFRFKISAAEKQVEEGLTRAIPRVYKKASNVYGIYFELAQPKLVTPIAMLSGSATININAPAYPKYHAVYIESADTFSILQSNIITQGGNYVLLTNK